MRRNRRKAGRIARLAAFALLALPLAAACGDGPDTPNPTPTPSGETNITDGQFTAADLIPDLSSDGFVKQESGRPQGATTDQDVHFAIFNGSGAVAAVRIEVNMQPTEDGAAVQFGTLADALRNPPPDLFGPNATQADGTPVHQADQSRSYVTTRPDVNGNLVYTDAHRFGRAIVIIYVIANDEAQGAELREQLALWIEDQVAKNS